MLALYVEHGAAVAAQKTGVAATSIRNWASKAGITDQRAKRTRAATEQAAAQMAEARERTRLKLAERAEELLDRINRPHTEFVGKDGTPQHLEHATAEATRNYSVSVGILIDKLRLELGEATSRDESIRKDRVDQEIERLLGEMGRREADVGADASA